MIKYLFLVFSITSIISCKQPYKYWDISEFNLQPGALKDGDEIKLVYTSQGPDYNRKHLYYVHVIAISQESNDTVNILTPVLNGFSAEVGDEIFNYISPSNPSYRIIQMDETELQNLTHIDSVKNVENNIKKVARDPKFDYIARNKFPTVIGAIGTTSTIN